MKYSVIVPTYNRASLLAYCLEGLAAQTANKSEYEIIVINDGSKDHTDEIIALFQKKHPLVNFIYIKQNNAGPASARNAGIKKSSGEIVFFTDDDCIVPQNWIDTLAKGYETYPEIVGVGGWYLSEAQNLFARYQNGFLFYMYGERAQNIIVVDKIGQAPVGNTANMSYLKSTLKKVGVFDETFTNPGFEDWELMKRILCSKHKLLYLPYFVKDKKPLNFGTSMNRWFNFGRGRYLFVQKHPDIRPYFELSISNFIKTTQKKNFESNLFGFLVSLQYLFSLTGWQYQNSILFLKKFIHYCENPFKNRH